MLCIELKIAEVEAEKHMMEGRLKRAEEAYKREKEALDGAIAAYATELDEVEGRLLRVRDTAAVDARINIASRRISEVE